MINWRKIVKVGVPLSMIGLAVPLSIYFAATSQSKNGGASSNDDVASTPELNNQYLTGFFPRINRAELYKKIYIKDDQTYISQPFINAAIKMVLDAVKTKVTMGWIDFSYYLTSNREELYLKFVWKNGEQIIAKRTYHFTISKNSQ